MPVHFEEYEAANTGIEWAIDPGSNAYTILTFLTQHPETGYKPQEIHEATDVPRGSVGTTLQRLENRELLRHKEPYWADRQRRYCGIRGRPYESPDSRECNGLRLGGG